MGTWRTSTSAVPPPSPIPTASGSRSAANEIFTKYLENSLQPPHLNWPPSTRHPIPAYIDLRSLTSRVRDSVDRLLSSAKEFGVCRIRGHGVSGEELELLLEEAEWVFRNAEAPGFFRHIGKRKQIVWTRSQKERLESAGKSSGAERYRSFSQIMENVTEKLDAVAEQLIQIFMENSDNKQFSKGMEEKKSVLTLCKYDHEDLLEERNPLLPSEESEKSHGHAVSLHLPVENSQFYVQPKGDSFSFQEGPETIVVTIGRQLQEWSQGEFKCFSGEIIMEPTIQGTRAASYSLKLECSSSTINQSFDKNRKTISLLDQILVAFIIIFLYNVFLHALSQSAQT